MEMDETLEVTATRELEEETGIQDIALTQFRTFSQVDRDPRTRVITTVFYGMVPPGKDRAKGGDDAAEAKWFPVDDLPDLGFDHGHIIALVLERIHI
jgi:8-oxo-dGTP diphosphatase